jgi:hypothetical protein
VLFPALPPTPELVPDGAFDALPQPASLAGSVVVFGDSLTLQSWQYLDAIARARGQHLDGGAYGGTALCDYATVIGRQLRENRPDRIVLAFAGNNLTPCIAAPDGSRLFGDALVERYVQDADTVIALARDAGVAITLVGPPDMRSAQWDFHADRLRTRMSRLAQARGVQYVDAAAALSPRGFEPDLPCLAFETEALGCRDGVIPARSDDGVHLAGPHDGDAGYSSGAWRYAGVLMSAG